MITSRLDFCDSCCIFLNLLISTICQIKPLDFFNQRKFAFNPRIGGSILCSVGQWTVQFTINIGLLVPHRLCTDNNEHLFVGDVCELATTKRKKDLYNNNTKSQCEYEQRIIPILTLWRVFGTKSVFKKEQINKRKSKSCIRMQELTYLFALTCIHLLILCPEMSHWVLHLLTWLVLRAESPE